MLDSDHPLIRTPFHPTRSLAYIGTIRIQFCARSFILQMYDVLARHRICSQTARLGSSAHSSSSTLSQLNNLYFPGANPIQLGSLWLLLPSTPKIQGISVKTVPKPKGGPA